MHELAKHCELSARQLSQYLNQYKKVHFFDYINSFRVEHLKALLTSSSSSQYTINALAEQSGFRSISTTYTAFKKKVGKTPAQFKKEQRTSD
ncbi:MAG: helix-turn-helix domain-containing protein [Saprospiraceae bacterium]|nr:helix-turn-helix domain-containing protein [Saprospiraceae bacterium]